MAEATSIRKAARKLSPAVERIKSSSAEEREAALDDFHRILEVIRGEWTPGELTGEEEGVVEIANALADLRDADTNAFSKELEFVLSFITNSSSLWNLRLEDYNSSDRYESIMEVITEDRPFAMDDSNLEIIFRAARSLDRFKEAALFLSKRNVYFEPVFRGYVEGKSDNSANSAILENFAFNHNEVASLAFLHLLKYEKDDNWSRIRLVELLERENRSEMIEELQSFPFEKISELQDFRTLGYLLNRNDLPEISQMMLTSALKLFPEDYELLKIKAETLMKLRENVEAYEIFKQLATRNNTDRGVIKNAIDLAFEQKLFDECQNLIGEFPDSNKDATVLAKKIECEILTSKFTEALTDLDSALAMFPDEKEFPRLKLRALIKLNKESEAFHLARELTRSDPENDEATSYAMTWLSRRGEYETIVNLCEESEVLKHKYKPLFVACEINEDSFKDALRELSEVPELLNTPQVVDAIFFNVRDDAILGKLIEIYNSLEERKPYFHIIAGRLRGIRPRLENISEETLSQNMSLAVAYIVSHEFYSMKSPSVPDRITSLLYLPAFREIRAIMDFLMSIYEGKLSEDVVDSERYLFPLTEAYIRLGEYDKAEAQLARTKHSENDPFYKYSIALIDYNRKNYSSSRKYIESAMGDFTNADFIKLALNLSLISNDQKDFREYLENVIALGLLDTFDFSDIYERIAHDSLWDMATILVEIDSQGTVRNPWILRLKRDFSLVNSDFKKAYDTSLLLFSTNQYVKQDVFKHIEILEKSGKPKEIINFLLDLETENRSTWLEQIIGDSYYKLSKYSEALDHYSNAIDLGALPEDLPNYLDTLIESGKYEQSVELVRKADNKLLMMKIYQKTSNIQDALDMLRKLSFKKDEDQLIVKFAAENLWHNTEIRDFLVNLYRQEGYTWLGKLIAIRTFESGNRKLSLEIARNLDKNNPEDIEIVRLYSDLLIRSGLREDAILVILQSLKFCGEFQNCIGLTNTLLRLYYEEGDYDAVIKFYETNPKYVDERSLQYVIRSYMETDDFDTAEKLMSKFEGTILSKDVHHELSEDMKTKKEFMEVIFYVSRLLKLEYKAGRKFDKKEAFYKADIPIEHIEEVYGFLNSRDFYFDVNEEKYEILSRDVVQKAVKNVQMEDIGDLTINVIYNNLERKDPIIARNLYIFIMEQMDIARRPKIKDETLLKLLRVALKDNIKQDVLHIAFFLKLGISEALDVVTLMEYMSKMNEEGDF